MPVLPPSPSRSTKPVVGDKPLSDAGKAPKKLPSGFPMPANTVPSNNGYKAGGMVRRGFGKARGA